jgi:hypothetical protein
MARGRRLASLLQTVILKEAVAYIGTRAAGIFIALL